MAYGEKYYHIYCDYEGVKQKVSILLEGYEGESLGSVAGPIPFALTYESTNDYKFDPIRPSKATVTLLADEFRTYDEFWEIEEREYKIEKYYNWNELSNSGVLEWSGFVVPNGFSHLFKAGRRYVKIEAIDGLSTLNSILFLDSNEKPYGIQDLVYNTGPSANNKPNFPYSLMFTEILRKLGLDIDTWISLDVYEQTMNKSGEGREFDPASQAFKNVRTYINDSNRDDIPYWQDKGQVWDCERVLSALLTVWGAKIYQENGVWRIKRVNADANRNGRYWHKYNTLGVYIGRETLTGESEIPCDSYDEFLVGQDNVISMDRVFQSVRVNYKYSFEKDAAQASNRVENPDFANWIEDIPIGWETVNMNVEETAISGEFTDGITTAMRLTNETSQRTRGWVWNLGNTITVNEGEELFIEYWEQIAGGANGLDWNGLILFLLINENGQQYSLVNTGAKATVDGNGRQKKYHSAEWVQVPDRPNANFGLLFSQIAGFDSQSGVYFGSYPELLFQDRQDYIDNDYWANIQVRTDGAPVSGQMFIFIRGARKRNPYFPGQIYWKNFLPTYFPFPSDQADIPEWRQSEQYGDTPNNRRRQYYITGFQVSSIVDPANEPADQTYIFSNGDKYTDRFEPITVYNGDAGDVDHISNIQVPSANGAVLRWDTFSNDYGKSSIGLILAKSVFNQYNKPYRMIDGTIAAKGVKFGDVIEFDSLPGLKFIVQRGTFTDYDRIGNFTGTLVQLAANDTLEGGFDNGNTLDPIKQPTGRTRCVKDVDNLNTGVLEAEFVDINSASETYNETEWIVQGTDLALCPIGQPTLYYWGSSGVVLDLADLVTSPWGPDGNGVTFSFTNVDGNYLYLLHLSGPVVEEIYNPYQGNTISDWQYLADIEIDGFTYRQLRMDYITGEYSNYQIKFVFST